MDDQFQLRAVIFDRDGVLVDTESVYTQATNETLNHFGSDFEYTLEMRSKHAGVPSEEVFKLLKDELNLAGTVEEIQEFYRSTYRAIFDQSGIAIYDGVIEFIKKIETGRYQDRHRYWIK